MWERRNPKVFLGYLKLLLSNSVLRYQIDQRADLRGEGGVGSAWIPSCLSGTRPLMKASMCTRSMSKRLNGDTLPGASVGFVGEEIVAVRNDLCDYLGYQVRAPRAAICTPGQSVECWLVGGGEAPGADGVTAY